MTVDNLKETVMEARTLHEVHQQIGLEREQTRQLLQKLNLLDYVSGRIATASDREPTPEELDDSIRTAIQELDDT